MLVQAALTNGKDLDHAQLQKDVNDEIRALDGLNMPPPPPTPAGVIGQDDHADNFSRNQDVKLEKASSSTENSNPAQPADCEVNVDKKTITASHQEHAHGTDFEELD